MTCEVPIASPFRTSLSSIKRLIHCNKMRLTVKLNLHTLPKRNKELRKRPGATEPEVVLCRGRGNVATEGTPIDVEWTETPGAATHDPRGSARGWIDVALFVPLIGAIVVPICAPFPDISGHLVESPGTTPVRMVPNTTGRRLTPVLVPPAPTSPFPVVSPGIGPAIVPSRALLPFEFGGQVQARPLAVSLGIRPVHADHGII